MHLLSWKNSDPASVVLGVLLPNDESACGICLQLGFLDFVVVVCFAQKENRKLKNIINIWMEQLKVFDNLLINSGGFQIALPRRAAV